MTSKTLISLHLASSFLCCCMNVLNVNINGLYKYVKGSKIKPNGHIKSLLCWYQ